MSAIPLLLIPGLLCTERLWTPVLEHLGDDLPSRALPPLRSADMADMAREALAQADGRYIVVGHSMGGYAALELARQSPQTVAALVLINTSAQPDTPTQTMRRKAGIAAVGAGRFLGVTANLFPDLVAPSRQDDATLLALVQAMADVVGEDGFVAQQRAILSRADSRPVVRGLDVPVTVIGGRQDALTPPELSQEMFEDAKDGELHILADCGHLAPLEAPEMVVEVLRRAAARVS